MGSARHPQTVSARSSKRRRSLCLRPGMTAMRSKILRRMEPSSPQCSSDVAMRSRARVVMTCWRALAAAGLLSTPIFTTAAKFWTLCEKSANISGSILSVPGTTCTTRRDRNVFSVMRNLGAGLEPIGLSEIRMRAASRLLICRSHLRKSKSTSEGVSARMMRGSFLVSGEGVRCKSRVGHRSFGPERFRALPSKTRRRLFQRG